MINRRNALFLGTTALAGAGLAACSNVTPTTVVPAVIDAITQIVAATCQIVPVVATLVDIIVAVFPAAAGVASITDAVAQQIAQYVCTLFKDAGAESGKAAPEGGFKVKAKNGAQIVLHGYRNVNGQIVYF